MDINDLTKLMKIDDGEVIRILTERLDNGKIYTNIGDILVAINPYRKLDIYDYKNFTNPHCYEISQKAIDNLRNTDKNQTILISGDSGSGKTFSTKSIINYLAHNFSFDETLYDQIVNSNPIIEVFGNAETSLNDNSSRFGKFIKIYFNDEITNISGIQIDTYLLEKSRVCYQNKGDFNFHIFNQLAYNKSYNYCKKSNSKKGDIKTTIDKMIKFGFTENEVQNIINLVKFILMIGEFSYDNPVEWDNYTDLPNFSDFLSQYIIKAGNEVIVKKCTPEELEKNKFTTATQLYQICFDYIIKKINIILNPNKVRNKYIGLLDIFGFEIFDYNNFEQLCINYTNEKLQNYHNFIIFQNEQSLYKKEGIDWSYVEYKDNTPIVNIFEDKLGIINLLDEECKLTTSKDENFHQKMVNIIKSEHFNTGIQGKFTINHYAGNVDYISKNFCEKNKQKVTQNFIDYFSKSKNIILKNYRKINKKERSVIKHFEKELHELMKKIKNTSSLFIKCIKPNNQQSEFTINSELIHRQLLFSGIYETIHITRSNYPIRYPIMDFYNRYNPIMNETYLFKDYKFTKKDIQFGNTTVFLKSTTYQKVLKEYEVYKNHCAILIQKNWKRYYYQKIFKTMQENAIKIQSIFRMYVCRRDYKKKRNGSIKIQNYYRMCLSRREYLKERRNIVLIQSLWRRRVCRKRFLTLKRAVEIIELWYLDQKSNEICLNDFEFETDFVIEEIENDLVIKDPDDIEEEEKRVEADFIRFEYEDLIDDYKNRLDQIEEENKVMREQLEFLVEAAKKDHNELKDKLKVQKKKMKEQNETNKLLTEKMNSLMIANFQLQERLQKERNKTVWNKIFEALFN